MLTSATLIQNCRGLAVSCSSVIREGFERGDLGGRQRGNRICTGNHSRDSKSYEAEKKRSGVESHLCVGGATRKYARGGRAAKGKKCQNVRCVCNLAFQFLQVPQRKNPYKPKLPSSPCLFIWNKYTGDSFLGFPIPDNPENR